MNFSRLPFFSLAALLAVAITARASTTISTGNTTAQTLSSGTLTVTSSGSLTVSGGTGSDTADAVKVTGSSSIINSGTISQTGEDNAIYLDTKPVTLTITNNVGATIQTVNGDAIHADKGTDIVTVNNYGTISSNGGQSIDFNKITNSTSQDTINNYSGGVITTEVSDAVRAGVNTVINNDGTIRSTTTFPDTGTNEAIDAQTNTGVTIINAAAIGSETIGAALIEGSHHGITGGVIQTDLDSVTGNLTDGSYTMSLTNNLGGTIKGDDGSGINIDGFNGKEVVTIVNHGTITGNGVTGDGDGVDVDGVVNITNTGTIQSLNALNDTSEGITVGGGTITNSGTIEGSVSTPADNTALGRGITIAGVDKDASGNSIPVSAPYAATTITNQAGGLIKGDTDSGIAFTSALSSGFSHIINNNASATIQGGGSTVAAIVTGGDMVTINNAGTIDGSSSGKAISGGSGGLAVNITGGSASVLGDITGAAGAANTMTIAPGAGNTFSYAGNIANFNTVTVSSGSFTLSGQLSIAINGLTAGSTSGYGQLVFGSGAEALTLGSGSLLNLSFNFAPTVGDQFTLINMVSGSSAITGTFANLADGSTYTQDGVSYLVSYEGGTGNDLVLTVTASAIPEPATTAMLLAGLAGVMAFVVRRRRTVRD